MNPFHFLMSSTVRESSFADEVQYMIPINLEERGKDPQTQAKFFCLRGALVGYF